ncbi:EamA family transporter [Nostoc sp. WHI]|uniref:EamA family transporter n=1 Tax=Nostoc sp. WHI TaxID=2650611 RepID=UPI0018C5A591|nr:EamA family transporter [Nostoc sp. WHI]MBG1265227.1 EamA family transporter [Nostoc sp. WHI]
MNQTYIAISIAIALSLLGVIGDYFLKIASDSDTSLKTYSFFFGVIILGSTAFGWVYAMKYLKLATIGVVYSVSTIVLLALVGVAFFQESLNPYEIAGIVLAIASLVLLSAFS